MGLLTLTVLFVGWLVDRLRHESEVSQTEVAAAKEKNDTEVMVTLTACARALQKALDKAKAGKAAAK